MIKTTLKIVGGALVVLFVLGACLPDTPEQEEPGRTTQTAEPAPSPEPKAAPEPEPTPEPTPSEVGITGEQYLALVRETDPWFQDVPDGELLTIASDICTALDSGVSVEQVLQIAIDNGVPAFSAGVLLQGAVLYKCPEHQGLVDDFTGQSSI